MDDPALDPAEHRRALRDLSRLNRLTRIDAAIWRVVRPLAEGRSGAFKLLDVATGSGDLLVRLAERAAAAGVRLELHGCDISPIALETARRAAADANAEIALHRLDVLNESLPGGLDAACCGLFLHHLDPPDVRRVLGSMARAARTVIVQDLRRTRVGLGLAWAVPRALSRSRVVRIDAVRSVRAAYNIEEMKDLAHEAGLTNAHARPLWPQRQLLTWNRP